MKVLHVETGQHLYGGAKQVSFLLQGLAGNTVNNVLCCPLGAAIGEIAQNFDIPVCYTQSAGDLDWRFFWQLKTFIRQEKPDLVHLHSRRGADVLGGLAAKFAGIPAILSRRVDNPEKTLLVKLKYPLYQHVITISEGIRQVLLDEGLAPEKVSCVHSAVEAETYQKPANRKAFLKEFALPDDALCIGVIAQLIPRKGHRYLLSCLTNIIAAFPNCRVLCFGQGPLHDTLKKQIEACKLKQHVQLLGFRQKLEKWLGCLDLVVHPADMEGLGVSLLQSAAAGLPIVASRAGGMPEIVRHERNGLLIEPGNVTQLQEAILRLLADPHLRQSYGKAGQAIVAENFSVDSMVAGNLKIYRQVLKLEN